MQRVTSNAREFRKNQTDAESVLWEHVRNRKLGVKIVRQKPVMIVYFEKTHAFIADFYCCEAKLVIEIDGSVHEKQVGYDQLRTLLLEQKGLQLIRFTNNEVVGNIEYVIERIKTKVNRLLA